MRLVTWNCNRGIYSDKVPLLDPLAADIAVIQECPRPAAESANCLWFGDNPRQGVLILAASPYSLRRLPALDGVPKFVVPFLVSGPVGDFTLLAVWAKAASVPGYVKAMIAAVEKYSDLIVGSPCVLMGDLNSSARYASMCPATLNHSRLVTLLASRGLVSAYHGFFGEAQGDETRPTYYHRWNPEEPFHIDYCFMPAAWMQKVRNVQVGGYEEWKAASDHRPLVVDINFETEKRPAA